MNRNILKLIALISMFVDHIGRVLFPEILIFNIIGRLAFPIFAFFIAEGYFYTRSKKRYILTLLVFAVISWIPFNLAFNFPFYRMNIIAVFLVSVIGILLIDSMRISEKYSAMFIALFCLYVIGVLIIDGLALAPEGICGVLLPIIFYYTRNRKILKYILSSVLLIVMSILVMLTGNISHGVAQFVSLVSLVLILLYNNEKGKLNLKYLFYISYPVHLIVLWMISLI